MDKPPGNELVFQVVVEKPEEKPLHDRLQTDPPHKPAEPYVDMDKPERPVHFQEMKIVDPQNFGAVGIDDLLVQQGILEPDFTRAER